MVQQQQEQHDQEQHDQEQHDHFPTCWAHKYPEETEQVSQNTDRPMLAHVCRSNQTTQFTWTIYQSWWLIG